MVPPTILEVEVVSVLGLVGVTLSCNDISNGRDQGRLEYYRILYLRWRERGMKRERGKGKTARLPDIMEDVGR